MRLTRLLLGIAALLLLAAGPSMAQVTLYAGDDGLSTTGGGSTTVDLSGYPIQDVFGAPVNGSTVVSLVGESLGPIDALRGLDTIIRRPRDIVIDSTGHGSGPILVAALRLVSEKGVSIGSDTYTLRVFLSDFSSTVAPGTLSVTFANGDGGTFNSSFNVRPKLVFTSQSNGSSTVIDCGAVTCGDGKDIVISATNIPFARSGGPGNFQPAAQGVKLLSAGLQVDSNGDGRPDLTTLASSNFFVGVSATTAGFQISGFSKYKPPVPLGTRTSHFPILPIPSAVAAVRPFPATPTATPVSGSAN